MTTLARRRFLIATLVASSLAAGAHASTIAQQLHVLTVDARPGPLRSAVLGSKVALDGDLAIVGAQDDQTSFGRYAGAAYLFDVNSGLLLHELVPSEGNDNGQFGYSVAINGGRALVGAIRNEVGSTRSGAAYLFDTSTGAQVKALYPDDRTNFNQFGSAVALDGDLALISAKSERANGSNSGTAYLFNLATGEQKKFVPLDGQPGDEFGDSVALGDGVALIGARREDDRGNNSGSAYIFDIATGEQLFKLTPDVAVRYDQFGTSVAIEGNFALIGASGDGSYETGRGAAYVFDITTGEQLWKLTPDDASDGDFFGLSVSLSNGIALIGSSRDDDSGVDTGAAYLFDVTTGRQLQKIIAGDSLDDDWFGHAVALQGETALIGAPMRRRSGLGVGAAYLFRVPEPSTALIVLSAALSLARRRRR